MFTVPSVQITDAHIEPQGCGDLIEVRVASSAARSHGTLSIDTNDPADPHRQTRVEFSPK
jgi:hypothetical protein